MTEALISVAVLLMLASGAWALLPRGLWREVATQWRKMPRTEAAVLVLLLLAGSWYGADKGYVSRSARVAKLLTVMSDSGELRGPTNVIASAIAGAAVQGVLDESGAMLATASNSVAWCWDEIPLLEYVITNTSIAWLQCEIPAPLTTANPVARADMVHIDTADDGILHVMVAFSVVPSSAPSIQLWAGDLACTVISNSFPATVAVETPSGVSHCYVYSVQVPAAMSGTVLLPERELTFGGGPDNVPLSVLGSLMINDHLGYTGARPVAPGVTGTYEGGILVEVHDD